MKQNYTRIVVVVDRSGSMISVREATVAGINEFITTQKQTPGEGSIKVVQFDDNLGFSYDTILDRNLKDVSPITIEQFVPRGGTPLRDAIGKTINELGVELSSTTETERPDRVLVCVVTDGFENASHKFTSTQIKEMIEHQTSKYNWQFTFVGSNQDAVLSGGEYGISPLRCMSYTADATHTKKAFRSMGSYASRVRGSSIKDMDKVGYMQEELDDSLDNKDKKKP